MTILSFAAVFAGLGLGAAQDAGQSQEFGALALVAGVFLGSAAWWLLLSTGMGLLRGKVTTPRLRWINWGSGTIVLAFAAWAIGTALLALG
jgi:arginine exporter protein ArgO